MTDSVTTALPADGPVFASAIPAHTTVDREFEDRWSTWRARGQVQAQRTRQLALASLIVIAVIVAALAAVAMQGPA